MLPARYLAVCSFRTYRRRRVSAQHAGFFLEEEAYELGESARCFCLGKTLPLNMIIIEEKLVSEDILDVEFACNLTACKGACCVERDEAAILEEQETDILKKIYPVVQEYLTEEGRKAIEKQGYHIVNNEGELKTPLINNGPCAYVTYQDGVALCGIEKAYRAGKLNWPKPVSCHLYPIRINKVGEYDALNYEKWDICKPACKHGKKLHVPVYRFVKDALIRKYGPSFYEALDATFVYRQEQEE